jgi:pimeloyl-ACP methyl ester carboxylesterase
LAGARSSSQGLSDIWQDNGDVLYVEYGGTRFRANEVVRKVVGFINSHSYGRIVLIGASMGGLLANDIVQRLDRAMQNKVELVVLDAPTSARDFQPPLDKFSPLVRVLPFGPIWNIMSRLAMKFIVRPPKEQNIEKGVDRIELARRVAQARSYPLSFWRDQIKYMVTHPKLRPGSLVHVKQVVYVRSERDTDTVRPTAFNAWQGARGTRPVVRIEVDSTHVGFAERPQTWRRAFRKIFAKLRE